MPTLANANDLFVNVSQVPRTTFTRLYISLNAGATWRIATLSQKISFIRSATNKLNLRRKIRDFSLIGQRLVEFYVATPELASVADTMTANNWKVLHEYRPELGDPEAPSDRRPEHLKPKIVERLSNLYSRHTNREMKTAILANWPEDIVTAVIETAKTITDRRRTVIGEQLLRMKHRNTTDIRPHSSIGITNPPDATPTSLQNPVPRGTHTFGRGGTRSGLSRSQSRLPLVTQPDIDPSPDSGEMDISSDEDWDPTAQQTPKPTQLPTMANPMGDYDSSEGMSP